MESLEKERVSADSIRQKMEGVSGSTTESLRPRDSRPLRQNHVASAPPPSTRHHFPKPLKGTTKTASTFPNPLPPVADRGPLAARAQPIATNAPIHKSTSHLPSSCTSELMGVSTTTTWQQPHSVGCVSPATNWQSSQSCSTASVGGVQLDLRPISPPMSTAGIAWHPPVAYPEYTSLSRITTQLWPVS
jgi:hypothetical protein